MLTLPAVIRSASKLVAIDYDLTSSHTTSMYQVNVHMWYFWPADFHSLS